MAHVLSAGTAGQKREGREVDAGAEHGGDDVAAGGGSGCRGTRETGQQGRETGPGQGRVTRGGRPSRRWSCSGGRGSCTAPAAEGAEQGSKGCQRKTKGGEGLRDLLENSKISGTLL
jgi:hypothetical protein